MIAVSGPRASLSRLAHRLPPATGLLPLAFRPRTAVCCVARVPLAPARRST